MNDQWYRLRERGSGWGLKFSLWFYRLAGRRALMLILFPVILYFFCTGRQARQASTEFLRLAYQNGSPALSRKPGTRQSLRHFFSFGFAILDKIDVWLGNIGLDKVTYSNYPQFERLLREKRGAIFIGSHLGNLEVCRALSQSHYKVRINVLVFTAHAPYFNQLLKSLNRDVDLNLIQVSSISPDLAIRLKDRVDNGEFVVIVGDRTPVNNPGRQCSAEFLGRRAHFSQGPMILASLLECPVFLLFCLREGDGFHLVFEPFAPQQLVLKRKERQSQLQACCQRYADRLGYYALRYPFQWFNFFSFWSDSQDQQNEQSAT